MAEFSLSDLNKDLKKINQFGQSLADSDFSRVNEWINTGNFHLNACLSGDIFKGIPDNRSIAIS